MLCLPAVLRANSFPLWCHTSFTFCSCLSSPLLAGHHGHIVYLHWDNCVIAYHTLPSKENQVCGVQWCLHLAIGSVALT